MNVRRGILTMLSGRYVTRMCRRRRKSRGNLSWRRGRGGCRQMFALKFRKSQPASQSSSSFIAPQAACCFACRYVVAFLNSAKSWFMNSLSVSNRPSTEPPWLHSTAVPRNKKPSVSGTGAKHKAVGISTSAIRVCLLSLPRDAQQTSS